MSKHRNLENKSPRLIHCWTIALGSYCEISWESSLSCSFWPYRNHFSTFISP